jgi:thiamine biosynthesis lipoprotein ApbE
VRYSEIMDPRTGMPAQGMLSIAVLTSTGMASDALDDPFFLLGPDDQVRTDAFLFLRPELARGRWCK